LAKDIKLKECKIGDSGEPIYQSSSFVPRYSVINDQIKNEYIIKKIDIPDFIEDSFKQDRSYVTGRRIYKFEGTKKPEMKEGFEIIHDERKYEAFCLEVEFDLSIHEIPTKPFIRRDYSNGVLILFMSYQTS